MNERDFATLDELEVVLQIAGRLVGRGIAPAEFLEWFRQNVPLLAPEFAQAMSEADGGSGKLLYGMGRALWNAMPQPSNRYRPRPLPRPDRNGRCPCGSGRKFKQCCAQVEPPSELFTSMNLLRYVLGSEGKAGLKRIDARTMDPAALDDLAHHWTIRGEFERALILLEPMFAERTKPPKHAELLLDTLFDVWPPDYKPQRRRRLAKRLSADPNPGIACVALQRFIVMLADDDRIEDAWKRFHEGMRKYPEDVNFAGLELTLLLRDNRLEDAKRRAEFWAHRLRRMGTEYDDYAKTLQSMVESRENHQELEQVRTDSPLIDSLARLIEAQPVSTDGYAPRPTEPDAPVVLAPRSSLVAIERFWSENASGHKPPLVMLDSGDEPLDPEQMVRLLEREPNLVHSFEVLDDLSESLDTWTDRWQEISVVLELVLQRAETMLLEILTGRTASDWVTADTWRDALPDIVHEIPWGFVENRSALRMMARHVNHLKDRHVGSVARWLPRARILLRINPNDNHGYRELVSKELLRQRRPADALALLDEYPDDMLGSVNLNRVLALFLLDRREEAATALRTAGPRLREIRKAIVQERYGKPRDVQYDRVSIGGRDEAWFYRQDMRAIWKDSAAIDWLKQQPIPRRSQQRKAGSADTDSPSASGVPVSSTCEKSGMSAEVSEDDSASQSPLSHKALKACVNELAPHGEWLLGLTLAAALTPGGGFDVKRLFLPLLERLDGEQRPEDLESSEYLNRALTGFISLYRHFLARLDETPASPAAAEQDTIGRAAPAAGGSEMSYDWITEDLTVVALDEPEVRLNLVRGLVAGIDGNPRGWSPIPAGARNNVIGPLRLLVADTGELPVATDAVVANASLLDPDDSTFQMSREKCLESITDLVRLARLAHQ
ncbi:MAG: SEC-C domain-containing protein [Granulosicoccus sp.]|nr:SEC-C domain-containing protein [Granulosicoccus sp.]